MALLQLHATFGRVFRQRCFYLFVSIVALILVAPFLTDTVRGRVVIQVVQVLMLVSAIAAVGRTIVPFVIALLLAMPALGFQLLALRSDGEAVEAIMVSHVSYAAFYLAAVVYLLRYVFSPDVMTDDKLFGAAAAYLLLGVMWAAIYSVVQFHSPDAFGAKPGEPLRTFYDLLYMSFGCLTSNGPGDVVPVGSKVRSLVILEQLSGTLFVAILIARLAGIYPPKSARERSEAGT